MSKLKSQAKSVKINQNAKNKQIIKRQAYIQNRGGSRKGYV